MFRNPHAIKPWIRYIEHKGDAPKNILNLVFERALKELPGSYKLWYNYLKVTYQIILFFRTKIGMGISIDKTVFCPMKSNNNFMFFFEKKKREQFLML